ncbi:glycosyltransferase-like protein, family 2 [Leptospira inadai serovar Lyme str. 10]|uniref:Glycosyltransferase-like protein, family 2 n=2 Tax=Leptospira inadai serovar Lyme TaxID=293084 RepID=V6HDS3_9LEPT|nr:cellulose synthase family protein [Leptospira inadai]EQA38087.1 glycosyltransferase-like protein, family 2 [Leptospira inadai serovar Lyme str. 10]PNV74995.1 glycosyl transferase [Leptospira inadai serovar Lyme]
MLTAVTVLFLTIYALDILGLFFFGIHTYIMVYLYKKYNSNCDTDPSRTFSVTDPNLPKVTVQLPIFNEFYVVDRLIDSTVALNYPKDKLEIQVLDDSTDETVQKAASLVAQYKSQGFDIKHLHRTDRTGHKAGALDTGMKESTGDYIAIFDADFIPDPDFLLKTMAYFDDPQIGMVQSRWGHINADYNILTKAQSFGIDGHFMIEQVARNGAKLWMNFNGTAGTWRKETILDAGGWEHDTLTEDFDLSYRAELRGWKFRYFKDVVCPAEIPAMMSAYKSQQFRWCKGSIQTAVKLLPRIWKADLPWKTKAEAVTHLINYSVHPLMIINILFSAPLLLMEYWSGFSFYDLPLEVLSGTAAVLSVGSIGPLFFYAYSQKTLYKDWKRRLIYLPILMMVGTGIAVVNTRAWLEAVLGIQSSFKRTPKLRIEKNSDSVKERLKYTVPLDFHVVLEFLLGIYCLFSVALSFLVGRPYIVGFLLIYGIGFFFVSFQSFREAAWKYKSSAIQEPVQEEVPQEA